MKVVDLKTEAFATAERLMDSLLAIGVWLTPSFVNPKTFRMEKGLLFSPSPRDPSVRLKTPINQEAFNDASAHSKEDYEALCDELFNDVVAEVGSLNKIDLVGTARGVARAYRASGVVILESGEDTWIPRKEELADLGIDSSKLRHNYPFDSLLANRLLGDSSEKK